MTDWVFVVVHTVCSNFVTVYPYLDRDFTLLSHFSCKKLRFSYILQDFLFGIGIWIWAAENLRSSHHASVVLVCMHDVFQAIFFLKYSKRFRTNCITLHSRPKIIRFCQSFFSFFQLKIWWNWRFSNLGFFSVSEIKIQSNLVKVNFLVWAKVFTIARLFTKLQIFKEGHKIWLYLPLGLPFYYILNA